MKGDTEVAVMTLILIGVFALGLTANINMIDINNIPAWISAVTTVGIFLVALIQINSFRKEAKRERTLNICIAYDNDPVITISVKKYREYKDKSKECVILEEHDRRTILNYFDVMAIGVSQDSYDFKIIHSQFKNIIPEVTKEIEIEDMDKHFPDLLKLIEDIATYGS